MAALPVVMTRDDDVFVPLETRISIAREAGADVFLSLHADALAEGEAQGATVYTLAEEAIGCGLVPPWPNGMTATIFWPGSI